MIRTPDPYGRDAAHPLDIPLKGWLQVVHRVWIESIRDNLSVLAAGCAFFALFALFPALSALFLLYGLTVDPAAIEPQFGVLALVLPPQAYQMIVQETKVIAETSGNVFSWSLAFSLGLALWSAAALVQTVFSALNITYKERERRGWLRFYVSAFVFAVAGVLGGLVALVAIVYLPIAFAYAGHSTDFQYFVSLVRWPLLALMFFLVVACLYRYGPSRRSAKWRWVIAGSVFATIVWLAVSVGFSFYVSNFANYDKLYGSLGAVIVLLFWLYLAFYIVLLGAEINAELELQTARDTTDGKPQPLGERGAFVADHVAGVRDGDMRPGSPASRAFLAN